MKAIQYMAFGHSDVLQLNQVDKPNVEMKINLLTRRNILKQSGIILTGLSLSFPLRL
jgi:hypothetical protein